MTQVQTDLLTELTDEQAATVEGGLFVLITGLQAIKAGADWIGNDDTYLTVDGKKIWGSQDFSTGTYRSVNRGLDVGSIGRIDLFDADPGRDDNMGGFTVSSATNGVARARVSGSGSTYDVYYQAFG